MCCSSWFLKPVYYTDYWQQETTLTEAVQQSMYMYNIMCIYCCASYLDCCITVLYNITGCSNGPLLQ